jgi:nitrite reductase/ring-hydroxylating ferredoxin subunit/uncharacterized membrane protein
MPLSDIVKRLEGLTALDAIGHALQDAVNAATKPTAVKNALNGTWLGHPLHPMLTDIPIGAWVSASVLDLIGGKKSRPAADRLVALGVLAAVPTAAAGAANWSDFNEDGPRRLGVVHAASNTVALVLYSSSYVARKRGRRWRGKALALAGSGALMAGGYLGGHLTYAKGIGVDRTAWEGGAEEWVDAVAVASLTDGKPQLVSVDGADVVIVKDGAAVDALSERCNHMGGPLHEGEVDGGCIVCPWHGSAFRISDGRVMHGPATSRQPAFQTRLRQDGVVQVRPAE